MKAKTIWIILMVFWLIAMVAMIANAGENTLQIETTAAEQLCGDWTVEEDNSILIDTTLRFRFDAIDIWEYDGKEFTDFGDLIVYAVLKKIVDNKVDIIDLISMVQEAYDSE